MFSQEEAYWGSCVEEVEDVARMEAKQCKQFTLLT
jgi:hypothetical protein